MNSPRPRPMDDRDDSDEWLIEAARRAGHPLPNRERSAGTTSWRVLLNAGISEAEVLRIACAAAGTEAADFTRLSAAMGSLLPHGVALKHRVAPLGVHGGALDVATSNPRSPALERELAFAAKQRVRLHAASPGDIIRAQAVVYGTAYGTKPDASFTSGAAMPASVMQPRPTPVARLTLATAIPQEVIGGPPVAQSARAAPAPAAPDMTDRLLAAAIAERASEAVLDPTPDGGLLVKLRIDGTLNDRFRIAETHTARLIQTLKQRARLDVAETKQKQQGRATFESGSGPVAVRITTSPLREAGERVVLRLFTSHGLLGLGELGYSSAEQHRLGQLLDSKGLVVVAGLGGAGKTTTLYSAARELRKQGLPVSTVEEPIDYPLERIDQVQVSESSHLTLASAVHAAIGAHGGLVMVDAPLDAGAMEHCVAEGARGRLVLASLDTSDMPATVTRLLELHPDRKSLANALQGVVAQRLVRRLCSACAVPQSVSELPDQQQRLLYGLPAAKVRRPVGCAKCRTTGYLGRMAIVELVPMTPPLRAALAGGVTSAEFALLAKENGMTTLWDSGLNRVLEGATSLSELLDTVPPPPEDAGDAAQEDIDALLKQLLGSQNMKADAAPVVAAEPAPAVPAPPAPRAPTPPTPAPRVTPAPPAAVKPPAPPARPSVPVAQVAPPPPVENETLRVLIVDDDAAARRVLAQALTQAGMQVLQASDGVTALAFAKRLRPHIVLTEVALPGLDAIGLLTAFAQEDVRPIVVVYTEQADGALDSWLMEAGAREVLRRDLPARDLARRLIELAAGE